MLTVRLLKSSESDLLHDQTKEFYEPLQVALEKNDEYLVSIIRRSLSYLSFLAGDNERAIELATATGRIGSSHYSYWSFGSSRRRQGPTPLDAYEWFLDGLIALARAREVVGGSLERRRLIQRGRLRWNGLKRLCRTCPFHCRTKYLLLEAEIAVLVRRQAWMANELYDAAISMASRDGGGVKEQGIANEIAARHYWYDMNDPSKAIFYYRNARSCYANWGAFALVAWTTKTIGELESKIRLNLKS